MTAKEEGQISDLAQRFHSLIKNLIESKNNKDSPYSPYDDLQELETYFNKNYIDVDEINPDLIKIWLLLMQKDYKDRVPKILEYLKVVEYGWLKGSYKYSNSCLKCRRVNESEGGRNELIAFNIHDIPTAKEKLNIIHEVFFENECG